MAHKIKKVSDVVKWRLCVGCGVCAYSCPQQKISLIDIPEEGIRPILDSDNCSSCSTCIDVCPGLSASNHDTKENCQIIPELKQSWGEIIEIWEGHAVDDDIRFAGSTAGLTTAVALYCLEQENFHGVLHIGSDSQKPWKNITNFSRTRTELIANTGSRYSPASPCDGLDHIEFAPGSCVFIGKPCDVAAVQKARDVHNELEQKLKLTISIFCAGTPSTKGTLDLLVAHHIKPDEVADIRYRGNGWPGMFQVQLKRAKKATLKLSYEEAWSYLQNYRPFRCYLCPDTTGEFADISIGDSWYRNPIENQDGHSLVLVRSEKGRQLLHKADEAGYIMLQKVKPEKLKNSQINQLLKRQAIWGRLMTMKIFGIPTPQYAGFHLFRNWWQADFLTKIKSTLGTSRRILSRNYWKPHSITKWIHLLFIAMLLSGGCTKMDINPSWFDPIALERKIEILSTERIIFGHASVGKNIVAGLEKITSGNKNFNILRFDQRRDANDYGFYHKNNGRNYDPKSKCDAFKDFLMEKNPEYAFDIAFFKFCFVDFNQNTNVESVFNYYEETINAIKKSFPNLKIIHVTTPLTTHAWGLRGLAKNLIKADTDNVKRHLFNQMLREAYALKAPVFDIAKLESTRPDGKQCTFRYKGETYYSLYNRYTFDGGHLNEIASQIAAKELLDVLAKAASEPR